MYLSWNNVLSRNVVNTTAYKQYVYLSGYDCIENTVTKIMCTLSSSSVQVCTLNATQNLMQQNTKTKRGIRVITYALYIKLLLF